MGSARGFCSVYLAALVLTFCLSACHMHLGLCGVPHACCRPHPTLYLNVRMCHCKGNGQHTTCASCAVHPPHPHRLHRLFVRKQGRLCCGAVHGFRWRTNYVRCMLRPGHCIPNVRRRPWLHYRDDDLGRYCQARSSGRGGLWHAWLLHNNESLTAAQRSMSRYHAAPTGPAQ